MTLSFSQTAGRANLASVGDAMARAALLAIDDAVDPDAPGPVDPGGGQGPIQPGEDPNDPNLPEFPAPGDQVAPLDPDPDEPDGPEGPPGPPPTPEPPEEGGEIPEGD